MYRKRKRVEDEETEGCRIEESSGWKGREEKKANLSE